MTLNIVDIVIAVVLLILIWFIIPDGTYEKDWPWQ